MSKFVAIFLILFGFSFANTAFARDGDSSSFQWKVGEELVYKVRWSLLRLGTVKMQVIDTVRLQGQLLRRIKLQMDSNPVLIFVNIHNRYECLIDSLFRPVIYVVNESGPENKNLMVYQFDYDKRKMIWDILDPSDSSKVMEHRETNLEYYLYDGISLTFFARGNARENREFKLHSFIYDRSGPVDMRFKPQREKIKIPSIDKEFETFVVEGIIHLKGIAGVTGGYKGWFTADERRIPLKALLKVFIGNVVVELESWKGWNP